MPLSMVHVSPLSVRVTGALTVTLAIFGADVCAGAAEVKRAKRARNADLKKTAEDNLAMITSTERATWWTAIEAAGTNAGFLYSLIGGGNRLSSLEPAGAGNGRISDGVNKIWDFGAGLAINRTGCR